MLFQINEVSEQLIRDNKVNHYINAILNLAVKLKNSEKITFVLKLVTYAFAVNSIKKRTLL